ncbi:MAG: ELM1/GtrOC1 family putative glycosyltransferase, partial [Chromatocurvus sp.]
PSRCGTHGHEQGITVPPEVPDKQSPRVWCLLGHKAGDNTQVTALADAIGWPWRPVKIHARPWELATHLARGVTLAGVDRRLSSPLLPPWPDLVISAGRRNEPVARWIRARSGGLARLVHLGRPWAPLSSYDLIVTTPQYNLPRQSNIQHNRLPLHNHDADALSREAAALAPRLAELPCPRIAVLLGGDSGKFVFTAEKGRRLGHLADTLARASSGSIVLTSSPRTPAAAVTACVDAIAAPAFVHRWSAAAANPYAGILGSADAFIVTGESMSMLAEASAPGRPLYIFDMADDPAVPWWRHAHAWRYKPLSHRLAMRVAPQRMRRDVGRIQAALVGAGEAQWLNKASAEAGLGAVVDRRVPHPSGADELAITARKIRTLLEGH